MARPSKLTEKQWAEIGRRLTKGEKVRSLAKEFGVSHTIISDRFSDRLETIKTLAKKVVRAQQEMDETEKAIKSLPVSDQWSVMSLADDLKAIASNMAAGSRIASENYQILQAKQRKALDDLSDDPTQEELRVVKDLSEICNLTAKVPVALMTTKQQAQAQAEPRAIKVITGVDRG